MPVCPQGRDPGGKVGRRSSPKGLDLDERKVGKKTFKWEQLEQMSGGEKWRDFR